MTLPKFIITMDGYFRLGITEVRYILPYHLSEVARKMMGIRNGDLPLAMIATLKDRIDVHEGRPQKYGTQWDMDGKLCPLQDASRVNEWRQEVGLTPVDVR